VRLRADRAVLTKADPDELFDRYAPGHMDATELENVLLLDTSGSMNGRTVQLGEARWPLRRCGGRPRGEVHGDPLEHGLLGVRRADRRRLAHELRVDPWAVPESASDISRSVPRSYSSTRPL
jgi:hypothetical protein